MFPGPSTGKPLRRECPLSEAVAFRAGQAGSREEASSRLRRVAAAATTVFERLSSPPLPPRPADPILAAARVERWCEIVARGDRGAFMRRLSWEGWEWQDVVAVLGSPPEPPPRPPEWLRILDEVMAAPAAVVRPTEPAPLPFHELLLPFLQAARRRLMVQGPPKGWDQLAPEAALAVEDGLLVRLSGVLARPLLERFSRRRPAGYGLLTRWIGVSPEPGREWYDRFVTEELATGLAGTLEAYPMAGRLAATLVEDWVCETVEFLRRLADDRPELERVFRVPTEDSVVGVRPGLSDPHRGGQTVKLLEFEGGARIVYKPRDVRPEAGLFEFAAWCERVGAPDSIRTPRVLTRDGFGWVEAIDHLPCQDESSVAAYYRRVGTLMAVAHALRASDVHYENLVAHGAHPVLLDAEVIMRPRFDPPGRITGGTDADRFGAGFLEDSVLGTAILPHRVGGGAAGNTFELGVLGAPEEQRSLIPVPSWRGVGTDRIEMVLERLPVPSPPAAPRLNREMVPVGGFEDEVAGGFRDMYEFLMRHRKELEAEDGPLCSLMEAGVRFVFRPTRIYGALQQRLLDPDHLRSGLDWSIELEALARPFVGPDEPPPTWALVGEEREAMTRLDVPLFAVPATARDMPLASGEPVRSLFAATGVEETLGRIRALDVRDRDLQTATIRMAVSTLRSGGLEANDAQASDDVRPGVATVVPPVPLPEPTKSDLLAEAHAIGDRIERELLRMPDGSITWVGLRATPEERHAVIPLDYGLYGGTAGISLFLSALRAVGGPSRHEELALDSLRSLRAFLRAAQAETARGGVAAQRFIEAAGGVAGLGLSAYALTRVATFLGRKELLDDATRAARLITSRAIGKDTGLDVLGGSAGAILGLLALYRESGDAETLDRAVECGGHLMSHRQPSDEAGPRAWPTLDGRVLAGFAHGAAGIAFALMRLSRASGEGQFREAALEGIAWEDSVFQPDIGNWPDLRSANPDSSGGVTWCHGAAGIGLARLGCLTVLDREGAFPQRERLESDVDAALRATRSTPRGPVDHLCCGDFGRTETWSVAGRVRGDERLAREARQCGWSIVTEARERGGYRLFQGLPVDAYSPGLFRGAAGIGYQLLRLAVPDQIPSLLLWE